MIAYSSRAYVWAYSPIIADFNHDGRLDIAFLQAVFGTLAILFQHVNRTFLSPVTTQVNCTTSTNVLAMNDFNNDQHLDIVGSCGGYDNIYVLFGYGNGSFSTKLILPTGNGSNPKGVAAADFNNDNHSDIAVSLVWGKSVGIFLGNGNGTFLTQMKFSTGKNNFPRSLVVKDFNNDGYRDIAVVNLINRNIGIFLGYNNGTFQTQKTFFTGGGSQPLNIAVGDFNSDNMPDVSCTYQRKTSTSILFGYGNGNLSEIRKIPFYLSLSTSEVAVADINLDGHQDIAIAIGSPYKIYLLMGDGNGNFEKQTLFSGNNSVSEVGVAIADLNDDHYPDIVITQYQGYAIDVFLNTGECFIGTKP